MRTMSIVFSGIPQISADTFIENVQGKAVAKSSFKPFTVFFCYFISFPWQLPGCLYVNTFPAWLILRIWSPMFRSSSLIPEGWIQAPWIIQRDGGGGEAANLWQPALCHLETCQIHILYVLGDFFFLNDHTKRPSKCRKTFKNKIILTRQKENQEPPKNPFNLPGEKWVLDISFSWYEPCYIRYN